MSTKEHNTSNDKLLDIIGIMLSILSIAVSIVCAKQPNFPIWPAIVAVSTLVLFSLIVLVINKRTRNNQEKLVAIRESLDDYAFLNYWTERVYIPMEITKDLEGKGDRVPLFKHIVSLVWNRQYESKYICLMGDTGSGKTDALVHFLIQYVKKYSTRSSMPSQIRLYTMSIGYKNILERLHEEFPKKRDKKNCILLLDALDECNEAQASLKNNASNNPGVFMEKLAVDTQDFAMVVVSCRKQFFMREEFSPDKTSIAVGNPSTPDPFLHWQKLYLAPFNDKQVKKYLAKWFNRHNQNSKSKKEAHRIVLSCKDLFLRPMVLSHIDILLKVYGEQKEPLSMKDIYDAIVFYWIQREVKNDTTKIENLLAASLYAASFMYKNDINYLDEEQYKSFCKEYEIDDTNHLLRVKSLLNNDKKGYKFSHKSFYEYLLAYWFFLDPKRINEIENLDFALQIYVEIAEAYNFKGRDSEIEKKLGIHNLPRKQVAIELGKLAKKLYKIQKISLAEKYYQEAFYLYLQLVANDPDSYMPYLATTLYSLAIVHHNTNLKKAETEYQDALNIWLQLAKKAPDTYLPYIATTLDRMALLYEQCVFEIHSLQYPVTDRASLYLMEERNNEYRNKAKIKYQEALTIYRELAENDPEAFFPNVAQTLFRIAFIHNEQNDFEKADAFARESLKLYHQIAGKNTVQYDYYIKQGLDLLEEIHNRKQRKIAEEG